MVQKIDQVTLLASSPQSKSFCLAVFKVSLPCSIQVCLCVGNKIIYRQKCFWKVKKKKSSLRFRNKNPRKLLTIIKWSQMKSNFHYLIKWIRFNNIEILKTPKTHNPLLRAVCKLEAVSEVKKPTSKKTLILSYKTL